MKNLNWLVSMAGIVGGFVLLQKSYVAYGKWYHSIEIGDPSGAELYELNFWIFTPASLILIVVGAFLFGRWSVRR